MGGQNRRSNPRVLRRGLVPLLILLCLAVSLISVTGSAVSATSAYAAGNPSISSVMINGSVSNPTITLLGSGFGTAPSAAATACANGATGSDYGTALHLADSSNNPSPFDAGLYLAGGQQDAICLANLTYSGGTQISFTLNSYYTSQTAFQLSAGDAFTVWVEGVACSATVTYGAAVSCLVPTLAGVAFGNSSYPPTVTVTGANLGSQPSVYGAQPNGAYFCGSPSGANYAYQEYGFDDTTVPWRSGQADPSGGTVATCIGITYNSYTPTQVAFTFGNAYGSNGWVLSAGNSFTVYVAGAQCSGTVSFGVAVPCTGTSLPPPAPSLTLAETHPGAGAGTFGTAIFGGLSGATPSTTYTLTFYAAATCGAPGTQIGTTSVSTDTSGSASFSPTVQGTLNTAGMSLTATAAAAAGTASALSSCITATQGNDSWDTALQLWPDTVAGSQSASAAQTIYTPGEERWYDFPVQPGAQVNISFSGSAGSVLSLHTDIRQLYNSLSNPSTASQVAADLAIEDAPSGYCRPATCRPAICLRDTCRPAICPRATCLPATCRPGYLPSGYLPSGYLPSGYLPSGYLPSGYLPSGYLPSGYLPSGYLPSGPAVGLSGRRL